METFDLAEAAHRSGLDVDELSRLCDVGILTPDAEGRFTPALLRRAGLVRSLTDAGISLEGLAQAIGNRQVSLDFLDAPAFERFSVLSGATFAEAAERTDVPVEQLLFVREAAGSVAAAPGDRLRDEELPFVDAVEAMVKGGFRPAVIQQMIRTQAESLRRIAETETNMWQSEVITPATERGIRPDEILGVDFGDRMSVLSERAVIAMYHLQQMQAWTGNIIEGLEMQLAAAGLHSRLTHPPAMCFLDITGYTRLTQEQGDAAAALLAEQLGGIVRRLSIKHAGRAVKWLGDGVMLHFPVPGNGLVAAVEMADAVVEAGLPLAHIGLHAGPVIFQEGDYYGSTVNVAARIAAYAQPGEVMVSQAMVDASSDAVVTFRDVGPVELKGVAGAVHLYAATRPS